MTTSTDTKLAWDEVADHVAALGLKLKLHMEEGSGDGAANQVCDALQTLANAIDSAFAGVGNAVHDPAARDDATKVAESLGDAIGRTLSEAGEEVAAAVKGLAKR
jgi:hypothetical protein